jgi:predicted amidohydrolase
MQLGAYITVPFLEVDDPEKDEPLYFNTICLVSPSGATCAHYRKNYVWPVPEKSWATCGTDLAICDTEFGRIGLAICFDIHSILARYAKVSL